MGMPAGKDAAVLALCMGSISIACGSIARAEEEPEGLRDRFLTRIRADLDRLPDFVCVETSERFRRAGSQRNWEKIDTVRFDVALVGDHELYSLPGARRFERRPLGDLIAQGSISTGELALLAKHVFQGSAQITYKGESEQAGRKAYEYSYDVPAGKSKYHLRLGSSDAVVAFQGTFWIDAETLDLLRLEVQAYDLPASLGLAQADTALEYSRVNIDAEDVLLPSAAELAVVATNGDENRNRARFSGCKHYQTESTIRFATDESPTSGSADRVIPASAPAVVEIPGGTLLDLSLDTAIDPASAKIGDPIKATLTHDVKLGDRILLAQGATASGQVVRLEKSTMPFPIYQIGLQFDSIAIGDRIVPLAITMDRAGPASGLLRQSKRLDPVFTRKRTNHIDVLVREVQRGEGILDWDAKHAPVPRGLRMVWRVDQ